MVTAFQISGDPEAYLPEDNGDRPLLVTGGLLAKAFGKALKHHEGHVEETIGSSASLHKRKREQDDNSRNMRARAKLKREIASRGRVILPDVGTNPRLDQQERELRRTAARGVVRLFNMVAKLKSGKGMGRANGETARQLLSEMKRPLDTERKTPKPTLKKSSGIKKKSEWSALNDSFTGVEDEEIEKWNNESSGESEDDEHQDDADRSGELSGSENEEPSMSEDAESEESDEHDSSDD